jgi:PRC-barrel domain
MVEIRRESEVTSSEGDHLGHVVAFVLDGQEQIAQLILEHGHLWGKRETAIPSGSIDRILSDEVVLTLSKDEVGAEAAVDR